MAELLHRRPVVTDAQAVEEADSQHLDPGTGGRQRRIPESQQIVDFLFKIFPLGLLNLFYKCAFRNVGKVARAGQLAGPLVLVDKRAKRSCQ